MKNSSFILLALSALIFNACQNSPSTAELSGTYVNEASGEASIAHDTLVVEPAGGNTFLLHRKTGFQVLNADKPGKLQYETEEWMATCDPATGVLTETRKGKPITFQPDKHTLTVGHRVYQRADQPNY